MKKKTIRIRQVKGTIGARETHREVLRGLDRGGVLLMVQRGRYAYHLGFPL